MMKKTFYILLCSLSLFAADPSENTKDNKKKEEIEQKQNKGYFFMMKSITSGVAANFPCGGLGLGYQTKLFGHKCFQTSIVGAYQPYPGTGYSVEIYAPRLSFLYYNSPKAESSSYVGFGLYSAFISTYVEKYKEDGKSKYYLGRSPFAGAGACFHIGYNTSIGSKVLRAFQLDCNIPSIGLYDQEKKYELYEHLHFTTFILSFIVGF